MGSAFEAARDEMRQALLRIFAMPMAVLWPDATTHTIDGYLRTKEINAVNVRRLLTDAVVPAQSVMLVDGVRYVLSYNSPQPSKGERGSQIVREYILMPETSGGGHGWSEFDNGN
ncbi:hypothetical protein [Celerinatantimonas sp. MCCC 1A17872]|uniref:hypothetical protein n=1 Tax=Celerinatantimonas sp. MCCC 1A17872 TaxID=3177514 RepID=UPI0038C8FC61